MIRSFWILSFGAFALLGFGFGSGFLPRESNAYNKSGVKFVSGIHPTSEFPVTALKSFVIVLYAQNDADWCERSLRSIFAQDYEHFRLVLVDDGSSDKTLERARDFIIANSQQHRVIVMQNETSSGFDASLVRAASHCLDSEIIVPMFAKDWMANPSVLSHWNHAFQNPDVWIAFGRSIGYPSYEFREPPPVNPKEIEKKGWRHWSSHTFKSHCFYSALLKQIPLQYVKSNYLSSLLDLSGGRIKNISEPVYFVNETQGSQRLETPSILKPLKPLLAFPHKQVPEP